MRPVTLQDYKRRMLRSVPCFEVYLNDPNSTDPADLITDLYAPLDPAHLKIGGAGRADLSSVRRMGNGQSAR